MVPKSVRAGGERPGGAGDQVERPAGRCRCEVRPGEGAVELADVAVMGGAGPVDAVADQLLDLGVLADRVGEVTVEQHRAAHVGLDVRRGGRATDVVPVEEPLRV